MSDWANATVRVDHWDNGTGPDTVGSPALRIGQRVKVVGPTKADGQTYVETEDGRMKKSQLSALILDTDA